MNQRRTETEPGPGGAKQITRSAAKMKTAQPAVWREPKEPLHSLADQNRPNDAEMNENKPDKVITKQNK